MSSQKYTRQRNCSESLDTDVKEKILYTRGGQNLDNGEDGNDDKNRGRCDDDPRTYVDNNQNSIILIETEDEPTKLNVKDDKATENDRETKEGDRSCKKVPKIYNFQDSVSSHSIGDSSKLTIEIGPRNEEPKVFINPQNFESIFPRESLDTTVNKDVGRENNRRPGRRNAADETAPEIYIDVFHSRSELLADSNVGSSQTLDSEESIDATYLADTIFFDPFENRRIDQPRDKPSGARPTIQTGLYTPQSPIEDGFSLSPIPLSLYPDPPPAYTENAGEQNVRVMTDLPGPGLDNPANSRSTNAAASPGSQKLVVCQHCRNRVHTTAKRECGAATHVIALAFLLFCLIPVTCLVYCTRHFKYINHYCPSCNKLVGYEVPILCQKLVIVRPERQTE